MSPNSFPLCPTLPPSFSFQLFYYKVICILISRTWIQASKCGWQPNIPPCLLPINYGWVGRGWWLLVSGCEGFLLQMDVCREYIIQLNGSMLWCLYMAELWLMKSTWKWSRRRKWLSHYNIPRTRSVQTQLMGVVIGWQEIFQQCNFWTSISSRSQSLEIQG